VALDSWKKYSCLIFMLGYSLIGSVVMLFSSSVMWLLNLGLMKLVVVCVSRFRWLRFDLFLMCVVMLLGNVMIL